MLHDDHMSNHRADTRTSIALARFRRVWAARIARHEAAIRDAATFLAGSVVTMIVALIVLGG